MTTKNNNLTTKQPNKKKETRYEYFQKIVNRYPSLGKLNIDGYKGYGYWTWGDLLKLGNDLNLKEESN